MTRLKRWWHQLWPLNDADRAYLTAHLEKAERTTLASRARRKRLEHALVTGPRHGSGNPVADMLRGDWPEEHTP
jgi:hypothetical protein